jgi:hypothetical protein
MSNKYIRCIRHGSTALLCCALLLIIFFLVGCGISSLSSQLAQTNVELHNAVDSFDRAIDALAQQSSDWQVVLQTLQENLVNETQSTIRVELNNLMRTGLLATGGEFRCDADFLRIRMEQELIRIRNEFVQILNAGGQNVPLLPEIPLEPHICSTVPAAVDMSMDENRRAILDVYGFDLRSLPITAEVVNTNGARRNVTGFLGIISDQQMVLDLTKSGASLDNDSRQIVFSWNGGPQSVVPILNPAKEIRCTTRKELVTPGMQTLIPRLRGGDEDFWGHGPCVTFWLNLKLDVEGKKLWAEYGMHVWECDKDWNPQKDYTDAEGSGSVTLYQASQNERIVSYDLESSYSTSYRDGDHESDAILGAGFQPVEELIFVGDTEGKEAGTRTQVEIYFRQFHVEVESCK